MMTHSVLLPQRQVFQYKMLNQSSPISKTAFDSLQAKQSAASVGYDTCMVVENHEKYKELLSKATTSTGGSSRNDWKVRRQTPLVNAGYASRVLAISHSISAFIHFQQHFSHPSDDSVGMIQLVFVGCGMDMIGLWAHSLVAKEDHDESKTQIRIVELDMPEVCAMKRELLIQKGLVEECQTNDECPQKVDVSVFQGRICTSMQQQNTSAPPPNYTLCPVDLSTKNTIELDRIANTYLDKSVPILAMSELVLAYLPPEATNQLLTWCANTLLTTPGSAIVTLEPLGYKNEEEEESTTTTTASVLEGYKREYCHRFQNKMVRGNAPHDTSKSSSSSPFYPLGVSTHDVAARFQRAGFSKVYATTLGEAAAHAESKQPFCIPEVFDEHASLYLHLQSYAVTTAFSPTISCHDGLLQRLLCPAQFAQTEIPPMICGGNHVGSSIIAYTVMEAMDEHAMREMFLETYSIFFEEYPAIRKMVKDVMNREFALTSPPSTENVESSISLSDITMRYKSQRGCFFVAIRIDNSDRRRQVVGCVGVRECEERRNYPSDTLEIFRLAVQPNCRGQGVGKNLLRMVEHFCRSRGVRNIVANTLTLLDKAMLLYERCGYTKEKDTPLGTLTKRTYVKNI